MNTQKLVCLERFPKLRGKERLELLGEEIRKFLF